MFHRLIICLNDFNCNSMPYCEITSILAAENGHLEVVKYLFENGANINEKDNKGRTTLNFGKMKCFID